MTSPAADRQDAPLRRLAQLEERLRADDELRAALTEERVARARAEGERDVARADRLEAALALARKGWLERVIEALRRGRP